MIQYKKLKELKIGDLIPSKNMRNTKNINL